MRVHLLFVVYLLVSVGTGQTESGRVIPNHAAEMCACGTKCPEADRTVKARDSCLKNGVLKTRTEPIFGYELHHSTATASSAIGSCFPSYLTSRYQEPNRRPQPG